MNISLISNRFILRKPKFCFSDLKLNRFSTANSVAGYKWPNTHPSLIKIVATIGPKSENLPVLEDVVEAGMRIMRLNFSHATYDEANLRMKNLKVCRGVHNYSVGGSFNLRAVMLDTQGPEIRTGSFADGKKVQMEIGKMLTLTNDEKVRNNQLIDKIWISYKKLFDQVTKDTQILLDDGAIELRVESKTGLSAEDGEVICRIMNSGALGNKKGVNLPGQTIDLPAMCEKDKEDIRWGVENDIDFIAASFTRKAQDVIDIRNFVTSLMNRYHPPNHPLPKIISKIESTEALANFDSILEVSDGIMVARGDLGVEIPMHTLALVQKDLVKRTNLVGKPVIVATQMLDSMQQNPRPTRAECTDVTNAIMDGADCVMLSGESAQGKYPVQSVKMMQSIINHSEQWTNTHSCVSYGNPKHNTETVGEEFGAAVAAAATHLNLKCIIVISANGDMAIDIAKYRPIVPIVCYVENKKIGRLLQVYRGIHPVTTNGAASEISAYDSAITYAKSMDFCGPNDRVVVVSTDSQNTSSSVSSMTSGDTFQIKVVTIA